MSFSGRGHQKASPKSSLEPVPDAGIGPDVLRAGAPVHRARWKGTVVMMIPS